MSANQIAVPVDDASRGVAGESLPATLNDTELAARIGIGHSQFYKKKAAGHFRFLELVPQIPGTNTRYSGVLVARWFRGEDPRSAPARVFFGSGRKGRHE